MCILLWNETKVVTPLNSEYVQDRMQGLNKNIWVQRHPLMHPIKWSHHQKIVVVDQDIAVRLYLLINYIFSRKALLPL